MSSQHPQRVRAALLVGPALMLALSGCVSPAERAFDGAVFAARIGQDATGPLPWIFDNPVYWQMEYVGGDYSAVVRPPCAPINAPVTLTEDTIVPDMDRAQIAAIACDDDRAAMDEWVLDFMAEPLQYSLDGETLILERGESSLTFERIDR